MSMHEYKFIKDWKSLQLDILSTMFPTIDKEDILSHLKQVVDENAVNPEATLNNNYVHAKIDVDLMGIVDWFHNTSPIAAGFGVFFKNQYTAPNPAANMLNNFLKLRKSYKGQLKNYKEGTYDYQTFDRLQLTEKINANSYYGVYSPPYTVTYK